MNSVIQLLNDPEFIVRIRGITEPRAPAAGNFLGTGVYCRICFRIDWIIPGYGRLMTQHDCTILLCNLTPLSIVHMLLAINIPANIIFDNLSCLVENILFKAQYMMEFPPHGMSELRMGIELVLVVEAVPPAVAGDGFLAEEPAVRFVPASEESIKGLERFRVSEEVCKDVECSVCLEEIHVGSEVIRLPCLHLYHGDCIVKWLSTSKFCPLCRFEMPNSDT